MLTFDENNCLRISEDENDITYLFPHCTYSKTHRALRRNDGQILTFSIGKVKHTIVQLNKTVWSRYIIDNTLYPIDDGIECNNDEQFKQYIKNYMSKLIVKAKSKKQVEKFNTILSYFNI